MSNKINISIYHLQSEDKKQHSISVVADAAIEPENLLSVLRAWMDSLNVTPIAEESLNNAKP